MRDSPTSSFVHTFTNFTSHDDPRDPFFIEPLTHSTAYHPVYISSDLSISCVRWPRNQWTYTRDPQDFRGAG